MAYVDHAFSISDEDIMMESSYSINNRPPIKEIALALSLLVFGTLGILIGIPHGLQSRRRRQRSRIFLTFGVGGDTALGYSLHWPFNGVGAKLLTVNKPRSPLSIGIETMVQDGSRDFLCDTGVDSVHSGVLLYADCILRLQGLQRFLFL
ncbi:transmembrane protein [Actinidia rufa]|uniref:Transmembrane protein n=1 Tax=Actinidia rufa TaxID=165716 RepID=A0A7J0FM77_9ERIC|nr:transmembrane protein [Actinidia rufa]